MDIENIPQLVEQNKLLMKMIADMQTEITELKNQLQPVIIFFTTPPLVLNTTINIKELAKEVLKEVLNPAKTDKKLTKSEQRKLDAAAKTVSDNLKLIQKHSKKSK